ncbi:MAG: chemotaxis response regulator protein-glutamate methylesterase [Cyclobacteriaceae bacterium]
MSRKVKILIVDDSALVRNALSNVFATDDALEVIGTANDPYEAAHELRKSVPDVITLDIEMPKMDGLTFLRKLMQQHPIPVVVISTLTEKGTITALKALEYGAAGILAKPKINTKEELERSSIELCRIVHAASRSNLTNLPIPNTYKPPAQVPLENRSNKHVFALGASTGGTEALKKVIQSLPVDCPGVVVVQHMPAGFTKQFAQRLDAECAVTVKEAENGDRLHPGLVLIAPGNQHMLLKKIGFEYRVEVKEGPLVNRHMPSVDVLFKSVARHAGMNAAGALLTGMGRDGAKGLLDMRNAGAHTLAQDEESCVVFGMPKEAIKMGAAEKIVPLTDVAATLLEMVSRK